MADPLPNNGTIPVVWNEPSEVLHYELQAIHFSLDEGTGVATCTLNQPQLLNALTANQQWEFMLILRHAMVNDAVRALLWTGRGRAFNSGADFSGKAGGPALPQNVMDWFIKQGYSPGFSSPEAPDTALKCLTLAFWDFAKPSVIAINGLAVGGGANIALANYHDIVLASSNAWFKYPFPDLGLTPELGSSYLMPYMVGMTRTKKLMMVGEKFTAEEAKEMGLVLEVHSPENLMVRAREYAEKLAAKDQKALMSNKMLINSHMRKDMDAVMDAENVAINGAVADLVKKMAKAKAAKSKSKL